MPTIGERMRELRESAGVTQTEIAKRCGSNQTTIAKMENGVTRPSVEVLVRWADFFDVSLDYLCCRTDKPQGIMYEARPKVKMDKGMKQFIEMCFDPKSPAIEHLKAAMLKLWEENET